MFFKFSNSTASTLMLKTLICKYWSMKKYTVKPSLTLQWVNWSKLREVLWGFGMLVFFTNFSLIEFQVRYLALFLLFSVIGDFEWFWMESLHMNIQLMRSYPFFVLHFSYTIPFLVLYINDLPDYVICDIAMSKLK